MRLPVVLIISREITLIMCYDWCDFGTLKNRLKEIWSWKLVKSTHLPGSTHALKPANRPFTVEASSQKRKSRRVKFSLFLGEPCFHPKRSWPEKLLGTVLQPLPMEYFWDIPSRTGTAPMILSTTPAIQMFGCWMKSPWPPAGTLPPKKKSPPISLCGGNLTRKM